MKEELIKKSSGIQLQLQQLNYGYCKRVQPLSVSVAGLKISSGFTVDAPRQTGFACRQCVYRQTPVVRGRFNSYASVVGRISETRGTRRATAIIIIIIIITGITVIIIVTVSIETHRMEDVCCRGSLSIADPPLSAVSPPGEHACVLLLRSHKLCTHTRAHVCQTNSSSIIRLSEDG